MRGRSIAVLVLLTGILWCAGAMAQARSNGGGVSSMVAQAAGAGQAGNSVAGLDLRIGGTDVAAPQKQAALAIAAKLKAILEENPAITHPMGYSLRIQRAYGKVTDFAHFDSGLPFYAGVFGTVFGPNVKPSATSFGNPDFGIYANTVLQCPMQEFTHPLAQGTPWRLGNLPVVQGGRRTRETHGYAIYDGQCVIVTKSKVAPFRPLTVEEYLQLEIGNVNTRLDSLHQRYAGRKMDAGMQAAIEGADKQLQNAITQLKQQLAGMSAASRQAPAAVRTGYMEANLVSADAKDAVLLSVPNPAFLNRSLPAGEVQVLSVFLPFVQPGPRADGLPPGLGPSWEPAMGRIRDGMDWEALGGLVH